MNIKIFVIFIFFITCSLHSNEFFFHFFDKKDLSFSKLNTWNDDIYFSEIIFEIQDYNNFLNKLIDKKLLNEEFETNNYFKISDLKLNNNDISDEYCSYNKNKDVIIRKKKLSLSDFVNFNKVNLNVKNDLFFYYLYRVIGDKFLIKNIFNFTDFSKTFYKTKLNNYNNFRNLVSFKVKSGQNFVINNPKVKKIYITMDKNHDVFQMRDFGDGIFIYQLNNDAEIDQIYFHSDNDLTNYSYLILNNNDKFTVNNFSFQLINCKDAFDFDAEILIDNAFFNDFSLEELKFQYYSKYSDELLFNKVLFNNSSKFQFILKSDDNKKFRIKLFEKTKYTNTMYNFFIEYNIKNLLLIND